MKDTIEINVRLFGIYREQAGSAEFTLSLPAGSRLCDVVAELRTQAGLADLPASPAVARNLEYAALEEELESGDEVALIPPVAGG